MPTRSDRPNYTAIADRLLAHAGLCEEIARECWSEAAAARLRGMAHDCIKVAREIRAECVGGSVTRH